MLQWARGAKNRVLEVVLPKASEHGACQGKNSQASIFLHRSSSHFCLLRQRRTVARWSTHEYAIECIVRFCKPTEIWMALRQSISDRTFRCGRRPIAPCDTCLRKCAIILCNPLRL